MTRIPKLDLAQEFAERLPELRIPALKAKSRKFAHYRQEALTDLLRTSYERRWPHQYTSGATSFSRDFLVKKLKTARNRYKDFIRPFWVFPDDEPWRYRYYAWTRPYRLKEHVRETLQGVYESDGDIECRWVHPDDPEGTEVPQTPPQNGMPTELHGDLFIPAILPLSEEAIGRAINRIQGWIRTVRRPHHPLDEFKPSGRTYQDALQILLGFQRHIHALGGLPNIYTLQANGRLGPVPGCSHLIPIPNRLRQLIYEGSGMKDFDIKSCYWSIVRSLASGLGIDIFHIQHYPERKNDYHARWAAQTGHPNSRHFKAVTLSWLTGGTLSPHSNTRNVQLLGKGTMESLAADWVAREFYAEVRSVMKKILAAELEGGAEVFRNAAGATRRIPSHGTRRFSKMSAHLLTGYEQFAIRTVCREVQDLQVIIYDGFIAPDQPTGPLEELIRTRSEEELGLSLDLELQVSDLSEPVPDPEPDPWDF